MPDKRKAYAPFSLITESGVSNAPVEGYIDVNQEIQPTVTTGSVNENGVWTGVKSDDKEFNILGKDENIANGGEVLVPGGNTPFIDMSGFSDLALAFKVSRTGSYALTAVMGPDTEPYANLNIIAPATTIRIIPEYSSDNFVDAMSDSTSFEADVWNVRLVLDRLRGQRLVNIKVVNNSGGASDIEFAYMRLV